MSDTQLPSFTAIMRRFPNRAALARDMGLPNQTVTSWENRNVIPAAHWQKLVDQAKAYGIRGITLSILRAAQENAVAAGRTGRKRGRKPFVAI